MCEAEIGTPQILNTVEYRKLIWAVHSSELFRVGWVSYNESRIIIPVIRKLTFNIDFSE